MFQIISNFIIPIMVLIVLISGIWKKIDVYDVFIEGTKESFDMITDLFPSLLGMIIGVNIFIESHLLEFLLQGFEAFFEILKIPMEILPMAFMRPISGSASLAILNHIFSEFGPDSFIGTLGSIIQGSTDTTFYILTLYFGSIGIKKMRYALWAGLCADVIGIMASVVIVHLLF